MLTLSYTIYCKNTAVIKNKVQKHNFRTLKNFEILSLAELSQRLENSPADCF